MTAPHETIEKFREQRAVLTGVGPDVNAELIGSTCLAVGFLLGASLPGAAAAVSTLADRQHPGLTWPW